MNRCDAPGYDRASCRNMIASTDAACVPGRKTCDRVRAVASGHRDSKEALSNEVVDHASMIARHEQHRCSVRTGMR